MPNTVDLENSVKVKSARTGKAQRMVPADERPREIVPPLSAEELQRRQDEVRKTRRPTTAPDVRARAALAVDEDAVPDVEETDCEERSSG
jgi:hypothetical protein